MALSQDLVSQFAKLANNDNTENNGTIIKGTYRNINGVDYVQLDGSDILTPVDLMVEADTNDRVQVLIKDHIATVTGNITSPSANSKSVNDLKDEVDEHGNTIKQLDNSITQQGNSIIQIENNVNQQGNTINQHNNLINQHGDQIVSINNTILAQGNAIEANNNSIIAQGNLIDSMNNTITQHGNNINQMNNTISQQGNTISQQGNTIQQQGNTITEFGSNITILNSAFAIVDGRITGLSQAVVDELVTQNLNALYANIDFSNIQIAAIASLFSESGIIDDLVVSQGKITGELVGVTIKGDLIEANTIAADKLVVRGDDGLYYKLNIDGLNNISTQEASKFVVTSEEPDDWDTNYTNYYIISNNEYVHLTGSNAPTWASNTYYKLSSTYESALDGSNIVAHSIVAEKIAVDDLVAFGATIGGFNITNSAIHTPAKTSAESGVRGVYLGVDGQFAVGDSTNYLKYYKDSNDQWKFELKANTIKMSTNTTIEEEFEKVREETTVLLQIESSRGTVFKNDQVSTVLSVAIYRGMDRITDMATLRQKMGNSVYLQWKWKRLDDDDYGVISSSDSRIGQDGFTFTLSPQDVDTKVTFLCELMDNNINFNMLKNSSFEKGLSEWSVTSNTMTLLNEGGYNNGKACKIVISETGTITPRQNVNYTLSNGESITFSVKIKTISGNADNLVARFANLLTLPKVGKTILENDWVLYVYRATVSNVANLNGHAFGLYQTAGTFIIDELKLELGTEVTDWCASVDD